MVLAVRGSVCAENCVLLVRFDVKWCGAQVLGCVWMYGLGVEVLGCVCGVGGECAVRCVACWLCACGVM